MATQDYLAKQILGQGLTSKWSGKGLGSAEAHAKDMAKILADIGITDISQFGPITKEVEYLDPSRDDVATYKTETVQTFGNKLTGQEVPNTYGERQAREFFGGTYAGEGNTGYGVQFTDDGTPVFYTQGASSSDIGRIAPLLTIASLVPGLQPVAMAANAAIAAKQGDVLGALAGVAGLGGFTDVANAARMGKALQSGDPLAIAMAGANAGGITDVGGVDLKDISKGMGAVKALQSGDPLAMLRYGMGALPKDGGLTSSIGPGNMDDFRENLIPGYFQPGGEGYIGKEVTNPLGPTEEFNPAETDWSSFYNTGLSPEEIAKREALMASLPGQEMQIDPKNWESYNQNLIDIVNNKGGYTSQWQTVGNDRVMVNDDGTGIGTNENGDSYALSQKEVDSMIKNGMLNTAASGYVAATGGTGNTPGGSGKAPTTPAKPTAPTKPGAPTPTGTAPTTTASNAPQQTSNADLLNLLSSKPELANIKSFKELFGEGLFGDSYVPPSAGGPQADAEYEAGPSTASQSEGDEQFFGGGHVDDFDVDALLQILRG